MRELIRGGANLAAEDAQLRTPLLIACEAAAFGAVYPLAYPRKSFHRSAGTVAGSS